MDTNRKDGNREFIKLELDLETNEFTSQSVHDAIAVGKALVDSQA